ncbi:addiction module antidote protein [Undibacterium sp. WLHG33]|uniref:addiction module antidote protein n=1 Tax=Undibacterium sp. WLHG33 TaxID=3412482 RepID=UPI003C2F19B8
MNKTTRPHDDAIVELLREDPDFANEYIATALEEADQEGGREALLAALRHVAEAQGMSAVAERAGIPRESLYRALSPSGNPTIKTLLAVLDAAGLKLGVHRAVTV